MRRKSPQRTRRIRTALVVGAIIGFTLGLVAYATSGRWFFIPLFVCMAAGIAAATTSMSMTDYDMD